MLPFRKPVKVNEDTDAEEFWTENITELTGCSISTHVRDCEDRVHARL